ncbi:hypothetical protein LCGC14_3117870 [marine sediment metagenome]|uniref:Uncharacterized protein n=1 Tax=marine sediment metagenome TaxID=412755 RepID=A0A0F8W340_9ZZZZ
MNLGKEESKQRRRGKNKMQEWKNDFSVLECDGGCCLNCSSSEPGCLCYKCKCKKCYKCKCKKCYWYSSPSNWDGYSGHCDKTDLLKERKMRVVPFPIDLHRENIKTKELIIKPNEWLKGDTNGKQS